MRAMLQPGIKANRNKRIRNGKDAGPAGPAPYFFIILGKGLRKWRHKEVFGEISLLKWGGELVKILSKKAFSTKNM